MVGEVLAGRYELEELVGTGGMSSVYRAHDRLLSRKVALKVLHLRYADDVEYVERFRREARAVASLSHPNIVTVIDRGEHEGREFIVFEYVEGENLKELIRRGPVPVARAVELVLQVASGLSFAHQQGLVHRDVKPQNVLLNGDGHAKVTDFGIARALDVQEGMTQTGTVLGTSDYIAPEQAQGMDVDEHSDVYSLGVVLYELLTGEVPFSGENFVAVAMRHINDAPPGVRDKRPEVSPRLEAAVQRAMAKDPSRRFATMADLCRELEACRDEPESTQDTGTLPRPVGARRRARRGVSPWPLVLVLAGVLVIVAVVSYLVFGRGSGGSSAGSRGGGGRIALQATGAYDPDGDGHEHDATVRLATDGKPTTSWSTEHYDGSVLGKAGVGLVLDAQAAVRLNRLQITTTTPGFTAEIEAGDTPTSFPAVVSQPQTVGSTTAFAVDGGAYRYYLIWITKLAPKYPSARINEVVAS